MSLPPSHGRSMCQSRKLYHQRGVTEAFNEEEQKHDGGGDGDNDNDDDDDHLTWRPQTGRVSTQMLSLEVGSPNSSCRRLCYKLGPERLLYSKPTTHFKNNQSKQTQRQKLSANENISSHIRQPIKSQKMLLLFMQTVFAPIPGPWHCPRKIKVLSCSSWVKQSLWVEHHTFLVQRPTRCH